MTQRLPEDVLEFYQNYAADLISIEELLTRSRDQSGISNWALACYLSLSQVLMGQQSWRQALEVLSIADAKFPDNISLCRNMGDIHMAVKAYEQASIYYRKLLSSKPDDFEAYNSLGRAQNNLGNLDAAETAFTRGLKLNPGSADMQNNLGHVYRARGDLEAAIECFETALSLDTNHLKARFNAGASYAVHGNSSAALDQFQRYLDLDSSNALVYLNIAIINHGMGNLDTAVEAYNQTLVLDESNSEAYAGLGTALQEQLNTDEAEEALRRSLDLDPKNPDRYASFAGFLEDVNRIDEAAEIIKAGLMVASNHQALRLEQAKLHARRGEFREAVFLLTDLETEAINPRLSQDVYHNLGKCLDRLDDYSGSMQAFVKASNLSRENERFKQTDPDRYLGLLEQCHQTFSSLIAGHVESTEVGDQRSPVFLLGFPRSGTTLLDLMIDSHPKITTVEEKPTLNGVIHQLSQTNLGYPKSVPSLDTVEISQLRDLYFQTLQQFCPPTTEGLIVDKMPLRTAHGGLIWRLFPNAKFVFSLRHPCDVCLSAFMQQFNANDALANFHSLERTAQTYDKMMRLWKVYTQLGLDVHYVRYESLVEDRESETRAVLNFLGLEWSEGVMDHQSRAKVRGRIATNSYQQVTEPIYTRAKFRWRRYREYLEPCLPYLMPHIEFFGYDL